MKDYEAISILSSAEAMTGNAKFAEVIALIKNYEKLRLLLGEFLSSFPTEATGSHYYSDQKELSVLIKERVAKTKQLIEYYNKGFFER